MNLRDDVTYAFTLRLHEGEFDDIVGRYAAERPGDEDYRGLVIDECLARLDWWIKRNLPHVDFHELFVDRPDDRPIEHIVDEALELEEARKHLPVPPFITHDMLLDNVAYLLRRWRTLGETNLDIIVPFEMEWPNIRLREMIWRTHTNATAEDVVEEIYRRHPAARDQTGANIVQLDHHRKWRENNAG